MKTKLDMCKLSLTRDEATWLRAALLCEKEAIEKNVKAKGLKTVPLSLCNCNEVLSQLGDYFEV